MGCSLLKLYFLHIVPILQRRMINKIYYFQMLRSTSYNGYGEALTSQPRSTRPSSNVQGSMDLSYVTERIISMLFPASATSHSYRQGQRQAAHMLGNKHGDNYMVRLMIILYSLDYCPKQLLLEQRFLFA